MKIKIVFIFIILMFGKYDLYLFVMAHYTKYFQQIRKSPDIIKNASRSSERLAFYLFSAYAHI